MSREQQIAIRLACDDLIKAMQARNQNQIEQHDWNGHVLTINQLIKTFPFLNEYKSKLHQLI
jgi:hypothetical protein